MQGWQVIAMAGVWTTAALGQTPALNRSDVVFMGAKEPDIYQAYGATMVSWGGQAANDSPEALARFVAQRLDPAHALGMRYCTGLAFRTAFAGMIDYDPNFMDSVTRDLDGQPINVPWLWDHNHKGHPAYWFCTNAAGYQAYLKYQTRRAVAGNPEGLHIDDYNGTSGCPGGCFCPNCMRLFTAWLTDHAPPEVLQQAGVTSLDGFDYKQFLLGKGVTAEVVRQRRWTVPLNAEYESFQLLAARDFVRSIRQYAEELRGGPLLLSVNSSATSAGSLVIAPVIDYFCGEVSHHADQDKVPDEPVFVYKIGDALGKGIACTAAGQDWAYVMEKHRPGLVRTWIAQGYAFGHSLMAPHRQWAYTKEKGTHWYQSEPSDYAPLYRFVREHKELFDGYDAVERVGVLYSNAAFRKYRRGAMEVCGWLARRSVPFGLVLGGDEWMDARLTAEALNRFQAVVVAEPAELDPAQEAVLQGAAARLVRLPEKPEAAAWAAAERRLAELYAAPITVTGAENVLAVLREKPGDAAAPLVLHLLNRNYGAADDEVATRKGLTVTLARGLLGGRTVRSAMLFAPGAEPKALPLETRGDEVVMTVDALGLWGVVRLEGAPAGL